MLYFRRFLSLLQLHLQISGMFSLNLIYSLLGGRIFISKFPLRIILSCVINFLYIRNFYVLCIDAFQEGTVKIFICQSRFWI